MTNLEMAHCWLYHCLDNGYNPRPETSNDIKHFGSEIHGIEMNDNRAELIMLVVLGQLQELAEQYHAHIKNLL